MGYAIVVDGKQNNILSPKQYLMDLKLKKAGRLLATTKLNISIIASSLGFDDQLSFSKLKEHCHNFVENSVGLKILAGGCSQDRENIKNAVFIFHGNDQLSFSKYFKKKFGVSPSEYRRQSTLLSNHLL